MRIQCFRSQGNYHLSWEDTSELRGDQEHPFDRRGVGKHWDVAFKGGSLEGISSGGLGSDQKEFKFPHL